MMEKKSERYNKGWSSTTSVQSLTVAPIFGPTRLAELNRIQDAMIPPYHSIKNTRKRYISVGIKSPFKYAERGGLWESGYK